MGFKGNLETGGFLEAGFRGLRWMCEGPASMKFVFGGFVKKGGGDVERCVLAVKDPIFFCGFVGVEMEKIAERDPSKKAAKYEQSEIFSVL